MIFARKLPIECLCIVRFFVLFFFSICAHIFYVLPVIFRSTKAVLVYSGLCFQQCHSDSGVHPDSIEFPRNVGHIGGRKSGWREEDTLFFSSFSFFFFLHMPFQ